MITCGWYLSIVGFFVAASPATEAEYISPWAQWGLAGAVVGFTLWRDWDREKRMSAEIGALTQKMNTLVLDALNENTEALQELKHRPCLKLDAKRS